MLNRKLTVSSKEAKTVFQTSEIISRSTYFNIRAHSLGSKNQLGKLLIVISKKIGNAVVRNLVKRRLKAIFYQEELYKYNSYLMIICKPNIEKIAYKALKDFLLHEISITFKNFH